MIFENNENKQAINIPFNWCVEYKNGENYTEFDLNNSSSNDFYQINQEDTRRFGLFGQGMKFFFENNSGVFMLNGKRIDIGYEVDGKSFMLTNNQNKKDFITYKEASANFNGRQGSQRTRIDSFNFGYKTIYNNDEIELFFQSVVSLPVGESAFIEVKLSSNEDLNGELVFFNKNKEVERYHAPLSKELSGKMKWTIK